MPTGCLAPLAPMVIPGQAASTLTLFLIFFCNMLHVQGKRVQIKIVVVVVQYVGVGQLQ